MLKKITLFIVIIVCGVQNNIINASFARDITQFGPEFDPMTHASHFNGISYRTLIGQGVSAFGFFVVYSALKSGIREGTVVRTALGLSRIGQLIQNPSGVVTVARNVAQRLFCR